MLLRTAAATQAPVSSHRAAPDAAPAPRARAALPLRRGLFTRTHAAGQGGQQPAATAGGGGGAQAQQQQQSQQLANTPPATAATTAGGRGGELDLLSSTLMPSPFRRMADHMMQMQREMDDMLSSFAAPLLGPAAALSPTDPFMLDLFAEPTAALSTPLQLTAPRGGGLARLLGGGGRLVPVVEVEERENEYVVTAEVPGFDKSEIKVSLSEDGVLTMTGAHAESSEGPVPAAASPEPAEQQTVPTPPGIPGTSKRPAAGTATASSCRYSSFVRALRLPVGGVEAEGIKAATQHGVLTVTIPKKAQTVPKVREIPVA
ncbi:hypothetical protein HXX76_002134 [Chlamydomonas incerta]|uniref:SHSP domain-containing protein n=1 Tax=Chlamydomonas incerta TaxID=51695 RepID=A0A835WAI0_CHLIN|nr:hypothetical protein HXX76_002134 [Chlamydomonas incerta]|eukprot:KAG2443791.1 hypothetical protein HXX76_002134 [Chlamydomonas incerta]